jgi:hypothetical protein
MLSTIRLGRTRPALLALFLIWSLVSACGGTDGAGAVTTAGGSDVAGSDDQGNTTNTEAEPPAEGPSTGGGNVATVTVDGVNYEFELFECSIQPNGSLYGGGSTADATATNEGLTGSNLQFHIQADGFKYEDAAGFEDNHYLTVSDNDQDLRWVAGLTPLPASATLEDSRIVNSSLTGTSATGTALFIEQSQAGNQDAAISVDGEFDISCSG